MFAGGLAALVALGGCSPLPGASLDPLYIKGPPQQRPAAQHPSQQPQGAQQVPPAATAAAPREAGSARAGVWVGRYRDSRGAGEVTFNLVRGATVVSGTWKLRTGGGGPVTAVGEAGGHRLQLRMENTAPECPGTFEGSAEITDTALVGTYRGSDCEGPVSDGQLELRLQKP